MKPIILMILTFLSARSFSADKNYLDILMAEPVTLHDMMIYKAQLRANTLLKSLDFDNITLWSNKVPFNYSDFEKSTNSKSRYLGIPITYPDLNAEFLFDEKIFQFHLSGIWYLTEFDSDLNTAVHNKKLKNTMDNISNSCVALLRNISPLTFNTYSHSGYSTKLTRKLPDHEKLKTMIESDTAYKVTLVLGDDSMWSSETSITCETNKHFLKVKSKNLKDVKFNYTGKWSNLVELEKEALKESEWLE